MTTIEEFELIKKLGEGTFSSVFKVRRMSTNQIYAMKKIKFPNLTEKEKQNSLNEIRFLASIKCQQIVQYKEAFYDKDSMSLYLIMEYLSGGDLQHKLKFYKKKSKFMDEYLIWTYLIQILKGLVTLHGMGIVHRDLKSANVFLSNDGMTAKIGDLNVSQVAKLGFLKTQTGTPYYASPEIWKHKEYDSKSDIWSLGCLLYEMCTFHTPFKAQDIDGLFKAITKGQYEQIPGWFSQELQVLIRLCLNVNPEKRPSAAEMLEIPSISERMRILEEQRILHGYPEETNFQNLKEKLINTISMPNEWQEICNILPKRKYSVDISQEQIPHNQNQSQTSTTSPVNKQTTIDDLIQTLHTNKQEYIKNMKKQRSFSNKNINNDQQNSPQIHNISIISKKSINNNNNNSNNNNNNNNNGQLQQKNNQINNLGKIVKNKYKQQYPLYQNPNPNQNQISQSLPTSIPNSNKHSSKQNNIKLYYQNEFIDLNVNIKTKNQYQVLNLNTEDVMQAQSSQQKEHLRVYTNENKQTQKKRMKRSVTNKQSLHSEKYQNQAYQQQKQSINLPKIISRKNSQNDLLNNNFNKIASLNSMEQQLILSREISTEKLKTENQSEKEKQKQLKMLILQSLKQQTELNQLTKQTQQQQQQNQMLQSITKDKTIKKLDDFESKCKLLERYKLAKDQLKIAPKNYKNPYLSSNNPSQTQIKSKKNISPSQQQLQRYLKVQDLQYEQQIQKKIHQSLNVSETVHENDTQ